MLIEYAITCGYPGEADLFVAQAVLQYVVVYDVKLCYDLVLVINLLHLISCVIFLKVFVSEKIINSSLCV